MQSMTDWWQQRSGAEDILAGFACYTFIFAAAIDIGRAFYDAIH